MKPVAFFKVTVYIFLRAMRISRQIRTLMAAMIGRPKIALGSADFASFVEYYDLLQKGKKDEAAKLADKRSKN